MPPMRHRRHRWFLSRAALAMFAVVVQTLLPFVLAAAIAGAAGATPICHAGSDTGHKSGQPNPASTCPICTALAASAAIAAPAPPALPLPQAIVTRAAPEIATVFTDPSAPASYRSRAPPQA